MCDDIYVINLSKLYTNITEFMYSANLKAKEFRYFCKLLNAIIHENSKQIQSAFEAGYHCVLLGGRGSNAKEILILNDLGESLISIATSLFKT